MSLGFNLLLLNCGCGCCSNGGHGLLHLFANPLLNYLF